MKVLSIGNSFSEDSHKWLTKLSHTQGEDIQTVNLFIGGCLLELHWTNWVENRKDYDLQINGEDQHEKISLLEALEYDTFDVITLQQGSRHSGVPESYFPYINDLYEVVCQKQPQAKVYFHQTWAYEIDSDHDAFEIYNHSQKEMYDGIVISSEKAAKAIDVDIIPCGKVIQTLRDTVPEFDYKNGGLSLCRDGFHLSENYGRFAAAITWYHTLTGKKITLTEFENFDTGLIQKIIKIAESI